MDGLLVVDKPAGPTSHDVVARVRRATGEPRVGHTGTLDPMASGVLPLVLGRATRLARFLSASDKTYEVAVELGIETETYDREGRPAGAPYQGPLPGREAVEQALQPFRGTFAQQPPAYSAKKIGGRRSYALARGRPAAPADAAGAPLAVLPEPVTVTVHALDLIAVDGARVTLRVTCSAGFYVRALAHDLGQRLGTGAHLTELRRTRSGDLGLDAALPLAAIEADRAAAEGALIPPGRMLPGLPAAHLTPEGARRARHGRDLGPGDLSGAPPGPGRPGFVRLIDADGDLVGIGDTSAGILHPAVVLV